MFSRSLAIASLSLVILATGCKKDEEVEIGEQIGSQTVQQIMPGKQVVDPVHGKQVSFQYGAMGGVEGVNANGVGYYHTFEDDFYVMTMNLNIFQPGAGKRYVAWVAKNDGSNPQRAGVLSNPFGDVRHAVKFETKVDSGDDVLLFVTEESKDDPATPGKRVAEGTMKKIR